MPDEPRKPGYGIFLALLLFGVVILYPLSHGLIAWLEWNTNLPSPFWIAVGIVYRPLLFVVDNGPEPLRKIHKRYIAWWTPLDSIIDDDA